MPKTKKPGNELSVSRFGKIKDLCNIGMEAMQLTFFNYNIIANVETKLPFRCIAMRIMTIIKDNCKQPPLCNHSKPRLDQIQTGFVF